MVLHFPAWWLLVLPTLLLAGVACKALKTRR